MILSVLWGMALVAVILLVLYIIIAAIIRTLLATQNLPQAANSTQDVVDYLIVDMNQITGTFDEVIAIQGDRVEIGTTVMISNAEEYEGIYIVAHPKSLVRIGGLPDGEVMVSKGLFRGVKFNSKEKDRIPFAPTHMQYYDIPRELKLDATALRIDIFVTKEGSHNIILQQSQHYQTITCYVLGQEDVTLWMCFGEHKIQVHMVARSTTTIVWDGSIFHVGL